MPKVSVIIPNYNHEQFLTKRIESVLAQSFQDFEIIILDDHSTDNSRAVIEGYRKNEKITQIVYNETNSGSTFQQWKKGLALASGEYIWIAESDDYADPEFLKTLIQPFLNNPNVVISFCRSTHVDENEQIIGLTLHADVLDPFKWTKDYIERGTVETKKYLRYRNTIPNASAVLFKKPENIDELLDTNMRFCGDWLFWQNLLKEKWALIAYSAKELNFFRTHSKSTRHLTESINLDKEMARFKEYKKFVPRYFINPFDGRFRWMMAEWIDRGVSKAVKNRYRYFPVLHPTIVVRYYLYSIKNIFKK